MKQTLSETYEYQQGKQVLNFNKVADPENWKMPTKDKVVYSLEEAQAIQKAVIHFTGSLADITKLDGSQSIYGVHSADGYYIGIGA